MIGWQQILGVAAAVAGIRVMRITWGALMAVLVLGACGQKGPLYLPDSAATPDQKTKRVPATTPPAAP